MALTRVLLFGICFAFFVGCSHRPVPDTRIGVFPIGTYPHLVNFHILEGNKSFQLSGVLSIDAYTLKIYMLTPMNVTALTITENLATGDLAIVNHFDQFKPYEKQIEYIYDVLRSFIVFPRTETRWGGLEVTRRDTGGRPLLFMGPRDISILIKSYKSGAPNVFEVRHPKFRAEVQELPK